MGHFLQFLTDYPIIPVLKRLLWVIFHRLELRLTERIVVGRLRATVRARDAQFKQQLAQV
jgi:hypothetical protein